MDLLHIEETDFMTNRNRFFDLQTCMAICFIALVVFGIVSLCSFSLSLTVGIITGSIAVVFLIENMKRKKQNHILTLSNLLRTIQIGTATISM